jgi:uncharacterized protein
MKSPAGGSWLFRGAETSGATSDAAHLEGPVLTPAGRVAMVSGDAAIRQSIVLLLTTLPGERVMRPDYGCPLNRLMFLPNDATTAGLAIHYVRQSLARFEPRIDIVALDAGPSPDDEAQLMISLTYRVKASNQIRSLGLEIGLYGTMTA